MGYHKSLNENECKGANLAIQDTLAVVNGKWKLVILSVLINGKRQFRELSREIGISPRILSKELRELEQNHLVTRKVCDTRPITVEYSATTYSETLDEVITAMNKWGVKHREVIVAQHREMKPLEA
jgi:DNA-binding HxlR family transcriptional regulator